METNDIHRHVRDFFSGHHVHVTQWLLGPAKDELPDLRVLEVAPGPKTKFWVYITAGASAPNPANPFEYLMISDQARTRYVEVLTILAYYGILHNLGLGHTMGIGMPLVEGSRCEHLYLSLPYTFGPELEVCPAGEAEVHILWAFPITSSEKAHLLAKGMDSLEERFEKRRVEYWSPMRKAVV